MKNKLGFVALAVIVFGLILVAGSYQPRAADTPEISPELLELVDNETHPIPPETLEGIADQYENWQPKVQATNIGEPLEND